MKQPKPSAPRAETERQALAAALREEPLTIHELSARARIADKAIPDHLTHLERSLAHGPEHLHIDPAQCRACAYTFQTRERHTRPSRCPQCRSERITPARYSIRPNQT